MRRGRFTILFSDRDDEAPITEPGSRIVSVARACPASPSVRPSGPKQLRLTRRDVGRVSHATTVPALPDDLCEALKHDLTQPDLVVRPELGVRVRLDVDDSEVQDPVKAQEIKAQEGPGHVHSEDTESLASDDDDWSEVSGDEEPVPSTERSLCRPPEPDPVVAEF